MSLTWNEIETCDWKSLQNLSPEQTEEIIGTLVDHYREFGFPYLDVDERQTEREFLALRRLDTKSIELENGELQQSMLGLATINSRHPEIYSVKCNNSPSPMEIFLDDKLFRNALRKRLKYLDRHLNAKCVRRSLSAFGGQAASSFRPTIAKWVHDKFGGGYILDPCAGYGGRMMGAMASVHSIKYVGVDPNPETQTNNARLRRDLGEVAIKNQIPALFCDLRVSTFESFDVDGKFDCVFTSPPYFNVERYSEGQDQSCNMYPTYERWVDGFLSPLIKKSWDYLCPGGYLVLNVGKPITEDTLAIGNRVFGSSPSTYQMRLSKFLGQGNKGEVSHKTEPIFVWKR